MSVSACVCGGGGEGIFVVYIVTVLGLCSDQTGDKVWALLH